ncbi:hypothetical protein [Rhodopila sp.]|jgi:hypothetical protein|uniref:hypothetical protein n=1 Tax=Rhodopila sp. TaxID=2480087 RepID=UPI002C88B835|nr:hypothetical protein [Rhodopila sp.]HVZ10427.1 hypothetical protein [Rhodopila sp.]
MRFAWHQMARYAFHLIREDQHHSAAQGRLYARIVQTCIIKAEDFEVSVEEVFRIRSIPSGEETKVVIDPDADDDLPYERNVIDLGEITAEQLGLAINP